MERDNNFIPIIVTDNSGKDYTAYLYKPQQIIVIGYVTVELFNKMGWRYKEREAEND